MKLPAFIHAVWIGLPALAFGSVSCAASAGVAITPRATIEVPAGFEISRVAAPPLVKFPMLGGFDDRGRLFVAENAGVFMSKAELAEKKPSRIRLLEDTDGDGVFDRSTVFADGLVYPKGVLWHDGSLYVASPPSIWRFEDTDGDGRADRREELATGFDYSGNAADVHGPFLHPNGRIYWTHAHKGHEVYQANRTLLSKARAPRVWSFRPDGTDLQIHAGGGMDNPVELVFNQEGEIFGTVDLFEGSPRDDAVVHWVYGGVYPRRDQEKAIAEFKRTGDLLGPAISLGHVAPAGLMLRRGGNWGRESGDTIFWAEFNTRRIMRAALEPQGASFRGTPAVFATAADPLVHFTDVFEDADGSLLIIDTGGWYAHCASAGSVRTDVFGGIYRIRKTGAPRVDDPRGRGIVWPRLAPGELIHRFADARPVVRERALFEAGRKGGAFVPALDRALRDERYLVRSNAVWALTRIATPAAQAAVRGALADADFRVRQAACQSAFITADAGAGERLAALLADGAAAVRREAARAVGRLGLQRAIPSLAEAASRTQDDPVLMHALIYALIEIGQPAELRKLLAHEHPRARRAGLIALDQIAGTELTADVVFDALRSSDAELHSAALQIALRHPAWGSEAAEYLASVYSANGSETVRTSTGPKLLVAFLPATAVRDWLRQQLAAPSKFGVTPLVAMRAIAQSPGAWDDGWHRLLGAGLQSTDLAVAEAALRAIGVHRKRDFGGVLRDVARDQARPPSFRVAALQAMAGNDAALDDESFRILTAPFRTGGSAQARSQAAAVLSGTTLNREQLLHLAALLPMAGPVELPALLGAYRRGPTDADIGKLLLAKLSASPGRWSLVPGLLSPLFRRFQGMQQDPVYRPLIQELIGHAAAKESRMTELEKLAAAGDAGRGRAVFASGQGACVSCHRIGETGAKLGPDLSHIGASRTARDLLEAIAFPSATLARGYESFQVATKSGETLMGTIPRDTPDQVILATADGREIALRRGAIAKLEPVAISLMPPGLDRALEPQSLADLVAYLASLK